MSLGLIRGVNVRGRNLHVVVEVQVDQHSSPSWIT